MPTLTAYVHAPERGVGDRFKDFLRRVAVQESDMIATSYIPGAVWLRFDTNLKAEELEKLAREAGFTADIFDTKHEEGVS